MGIGTQFVLGGLLQGLGKGVDNVVQQRREDALLALKRQQQQQDLQAGYAREDATHARDRQEKLADAATLAEEKKGLLQVAGTQKLAEIAETGKQNRLNRAADYTYDVKLEDVKAALDIKKDAASKQLAAKLEKETPQIHGVETAADGSMVLVYKDGRREVTSQKLYIKPTSEDDSGGSIADARAGRTGSPAPSSTPASEPATPAAPKTDENAAARAAAYNRLVQVYETATPENAPGLFRNGRKISIEEAKNKILQRYPK